MIRHNLGLAGCLFRECVTCLYDIRSLVGVRDPPLGVYDPS